MYNSTLAVKKLILSLKGEKKICKCPIVDRYSRQAPCGNDIKQLSPLPVFPEWLASSLRYLLVDNVCTVMELCRYYLDLFEREHGSTPISVLRAQTSGSA